MKDYHCRFQEGKFYHVYNRGNNKENLFHSTENYMYFLKKYDEYLSDWVDTYAYSLLPNHFHVLLKIKEIHLRENNALKKGQKLLTHTDEIISEQFRKFFTSYSKSINKQEGRTGSLFQKKFKRIQIDSDFYFTKLIYYIHANSELHKISSDYKKYKYSSYQSILSEQPTKLKREEVLEWFGGKQSFISFHQQMLDYKLMTDVVIED